MGIASREPTVLAQAREQECRTTPGGFCVLIPVKVLTRSNKPEEHLSSHKRAAGERFASDHSALRAPVW